MRIFIYLVVLFTSKFSVAGFMHGWDSVDALPEVRICGDYRGFHIREGSGPVLNFKFTGYGEDRSTHNYTTAAGEFRLVSKEWGQFFFLLDSQGNSHQIQRGAQSHGLCPVNVEEWP